MVKKAAKQKRTRYSAEFKQQVVERALAGQQPVTQLARALGLHDSRSHTWIAKHKADQATGQETKELQAELARVKRENARLQEDLAILKKAAAYFAKELK